MGAKIRSKTNWALCAELPTKYLLNLEKKKAQKRTIERLQTDSGEFITNQNDILNEIKKYYQDFILYTTRGGETYSYLLRLKLRQLSQVDKEENISLSELGQALKDMKNAKSPGTDGLPCEFYKLFWPKIKEFYYQVILEVIEEDEFHLTARRGIISLLEKIGKSGLKLPEWRPLSLLNCDNKIYTKAIASRLQKLQKEYIHPSQTGFKGRYMAEGVMKILEVIHRCETEGRDGLLISFDFRKAFDTVEWNSMFEVLKRRNFGENYIKMVKVIFQNPLPCAYNNGYRSEFFPLTRGCQQGCCFSPVIFTEVIECLGEGIRQND